MCLIEFENAFYMPALNGVCVESMETVLTSGGGGTLLFSRWPVVTCVLCCTTKKMDRGEAMCWIVSETMLRGV